MADLSEKKIITPANFYGFGYNYSIQLDKWNLQDLAADYIYIGQNTLDFEVPGTLGVIVNFSSWIENHASKPEQIYRVHPILHNGISKTTLRVAVFHCRLPSRLFYTS